MIKALIPMFLTLIIIGCKTIEPKKEKIVIDHHKTNKERIVLDYLKTNKVDTIDTYFGVEVKDPYRWLEDDRSAETEAWVTAENELTFGYLDKIPFRDELKERLSSLWNYEKVGAPFKEGDYTYF